MKTVEIEVRKWAGDKRSSVPAFSLGEDEHGVWLAVARGTPYVWYGEETRAPFDFMWLVSPGSWWGAKFFDEAESDIYVDVTMPPEWHGERVTICDLDLDVIRWLDGRIELLDEEEFERHRVELGYPDDLVMRARQVAGDMTRWVAEAREPFGLVWQDWKARMRAALERT